MPGKAVLHFEKKGKSNGGSLGAHIDREEGKEYSYRHADLNLTKNNIHIKVNELCDMPYNKAIEERIKQGYWNLNKAGTLKEIRKDAVHSVNTILSGSHEEMLKISCDPNLLEQWIKRNLEFCKNRFGEKNITRFVVHLDEKTPHIHCVFVPITNDGRLSVGDWIGNGKKLENFQSDYAEAMSEFGLERGVKSERKHHTTDDYRRRELYKLEENKDVLKDLEDLKQTDIFNFNSKKEALSSKIENLILNIDESSKKEIEALKSKVSSLEDKNELLKKQQFALTGKPASYFSEEQIIAICNRVSVKDYFLYLMEKGSVDFVKKSGEEYFFKSNTRTYSVKNKSFCDVSTGTGGQIIKAVMEIEGISWKTAIEFLTRFMNTKNYTDLHKSIFEESDQLKEKTFKISAVLKTNNLKILEHFKRNLGIDVETMKEHTKQFHFQFKKEGRDYHSFGVGLQNYSNGFELQTEKRKMNLGDSGITETGDKNAEKLIIFNQMIDMLSFLQILRDNNKKASDYRLICLNSLDNLGKFVELFQDYKGNNISICLESNEEGDKATKQIKDFFHNANDIRENYGIFEGQNGSKNLNEVLLKEKGILKQNRGMKI